jgi:hypothetical protein
VGNPAVFSSNEVRILGAVPSNLTQEGESYSVGERRSMAKHGWIIVGAVVAVVAVAFADWPSSSWGRCTFVGPNTVRSSTLDHRLIEAVSDRQWNETRRLLHLGASANARDRAKYPVLTDVELCGELETVKLLLERGAKIDARGPGGETALMVAAARAHPRVVSLLVARGARVNLRSDSGATALSLVTEKNAFPSGDRWGDAASLKTIKLLKRAGAK